MAAQMSDISYVTGDATSPIGDGVKIIAHICNDVGLWGRGFVMAISEQWSFPELDYRLWSSCENSFRLGNTRLVQVECDIYVANMIAQHNIRGSAGSGPPIRYYAVASCLDKLATEAKTLNASVHMPRIGCGLAGGSWDKIEPMIKKYLIDKGVSVTVYDLTR